MLRNDGKYEIYIIEFKAMGERWGQLNFDSVWFPPEIYESKRDLINEFSSSGKCWQETGVNGTYDVENAIKMYLLLRQHSVKQHYTFRVNKKTITQESDILWGG